MTSSQAPNVPSTGDQPVPVEEDLNCVLNDAQRIELISLVEDTMDAMQEILCHPSECGTSASPEIPSGSPDSDATVRQSNFQGGLLVDSEQIKIELDALDYFKAWKQSVLCRIREVIDLGKAPELQCQVGGVTAGSGILPLRNKDTNRPVPILPTRQVSSSTPLEHSPTTLEQLPLKSRLLIINSLLFLVLSLKSYSAHSRALLLQISDKLAVPPEDLVAIEIKVAQGLLRAANEMSAEEEAKARAAESKTIRRWKIGLASVAGALLVGVTGGLAAPLVAGSIGMIMATFGLGGTVAATYLGAVAGSYVVIGSIFGAFGAKMSGRMMRQYAKAVKDFAFVPLKSHPLNPEHESACTATNNRLRVTIGVSGWLTEATDIVIPWQVLGGDSDVFALRWELKALLILGNSMETLVRRTAFGIAAQQVLGKTILAPFAGPLVLPLIAAKTSYIVDNPFGIAKNRALKAGEILADAIINKVQGERPVTLIGYSMGARVMYACLLSLAKRRVFGLIEAAIFLGSPAPADTPKWQLIRTVVSGRLINVYSQNDYMLRFLYRTQSMQMNVAGIQPIQEVPGIENFDASEIVSGHLRYPLVVGALLDQIGIHGLDKDELQRQVHRFQALTKDGKRFDRKREGDQTDGTADGDLQDQFDQYQYDSFANPEAALQSIEEEITQKTEEQLIQIQMQSVQIDDCEEEEEEEVTVSGATPQKP